jgi:3-hydroxyisobutyrate dehydrogenase-like beta-hydroxyacid dehydrogenase
MGGHLEGVRVGFIGTGHMGNPMAENLIKAGHDVTVADARREAIENLIALGAREAASAAGVARQSEVVFMSGPRVSGEDPLRQA